MHALTASPSLTLAVAAAARYARPSWEAGRARLGLTTDEALALAALCDADGTSLTGMAVRLHVPRRSVVRVVARLEAEGRVERDGDEVWLTPPGRALREPLQESLRGLVA